MGNVPIMALPRNTVFNSCKAALTVTASGSTVAPRAGSGE